MFGAEVHDLRLRSPKVPEPRRALCARGRAACCGREARSEPAASLHPAPRRARETTHPCTGQQMVQTDRTVVHPNCDALVRAAVAERGGNAGAQWRCEGPDDTAEIAHGEAAGVCVWGRAGVAPTEDSRKSRYAQPRLPRLRFEDLCRAPFSMDHERTEVAHAATTVSEGDVPAWRLRIRENRLLLR